MIRRALLSRARRGKGTETGMLRGHSMRVQEERSFAWVPLLVFAVVSLAILAFVVAHGDEVVMTVGAVLAKLIR